MLLDGMMINYVWVIEARWTFKNEHSVKETQLHVIAPNIIVACEKANKILIKTHDNFKRIGGRSERNLGVIHSAEKLEKIDT